MCRIPSWSCRFTPPGAAICHSAKRFLEEHGVVYTEINLDSDPVASAEVLKRVGKRAVPQLVIDGEWFQPYTPGRGLLIDELMRRLGIHSRIIAVLVQLNRSLMPQLLAVQEFSVDRRYTPGDGRHLDNGRE